MPVPAKLLMAILIGGILGRPVGDVSSTVWINPHTGKMYSPKPWHRDAKTPLQLEKRRRFKQVAPLLRYVYKPLLKPLWGRKIKRLTGYGFAIGLTLAHYEEWRGVPKLYFFRYPDAWRVPYTMYTTYPGALFHCVFGNRAWTGWPVNTHFRIMVVDENCARLWLSADIAYNETNDVYIPRKGWDYNRAYYVKVIPWTYDSTGLVVYLPENGAYYVGGSWHDLP